MIILNNVYITIMYLYYHLNVSVVDRRQSVSIQRLGQFQFGVGVVRVADELDQTELREFHCPRTFRRDLQQGVDDFRFLIT